MEEREIRKEDFTMGSLTTTTNTKGRICLSPQTVACACLRMSHTSLHPPWTAHAYLISILKGVPHVAMPTLSDPSLHNRFQVFHEAAPSPNEHSSHVHSLLAGHLTVVALRQFSSGPCMLHWYSRSLAHA